MTFEDVSETMRNFLGCHEIFRRLGFAPGDIYCIVNVLGDTHVALARLEAQGLTFSVDCGRIDREAFLAEYQRLVVDGGLKELDEETAQRLFEESKARQQAAIIITKLALRGFVFPKHLAKSLTLN